jgi:dephospho-CoA kinase
MITVGVTGGIASGKSALVALWARLGARTIDADRVGWEQLDRPEIRESLLYAFGPDVLGDGGEIDRRKLGAAAFRDPERVETLNAILHPPILSALGEMIEAQRRASPEGVLVLEASVLVEARGTALVDYVVLVTAPPRARLARLAARGVTEEEALARMRAQATDVEKARFADFVVENDGTLAGLEEKGRRLWTTIASLPPRSIEQRGGEKEGTTI